MGHLLDQFSAVLLLADRRSVFVCLFLFCFSGQSEIVKDEWLNRNFHTSTQTDPNPVSYSVDLLDFVLYFYWKETLAPLTQTSGM